MKRFSLKSAVLVSIIMLLPALISAESDMSRLNRERIEVGRALLEMNAENWQSLLPHYTQDIEYHDPIVDIYGFDMMAQFLQRLLVISSPDLITTVEDEICINDQYMASWTMVGSFGGVPYSAKGTTIMKFRKRSTMVYYQRDYYSEGDIMANIPGLDEPLSMFRAYYRCAVDPTYDCPFGPANSELLPDAHSTGVDDSRHRDEQMPNIKDPKGDKARINIERKKIGRALIELTAENWPGVIPYLTDDYEYHDPIVNIYTPDTMAIFLGRLFINSAGLITTVEDEICINGVYMCTWTMAGQFDGVPFSAPGMSIVKFRPGETQSYYSRDYYTEGDIMINIPGLDEPTEAFRTYYRCAVDPTFICPLGQTMGAAAPGEKTAEPSSPSSQEVFKLRQNVPNPFNPSTTIAFEVPDGGAEISLRVYDVSGRLVRTLFQGYEPAGARTVTWNGTNDQGQPMASGIYFYRMTAPMYSEQKKMILLR